LHEGERILFDASAGGRAVGAEAAADEEMVSWIFDFDFGLAEKGDRGAARVAAA
jgi:hypothetical protein